MKIFKEIEKCSSLSDVDNYIANKTPPWLWFGVSNANEGKEVEFIEDDQVLSGTVVKAVDNLRSLVVVGKVHYVVLNIKFLHPVEPTFPHATKLANSDTKMPLGEQSRVKEVDEKSSERLTSSFTPSIYQQKIIEGMAKRQTQVAGLDGLKNMIVEALAGCAKSSTLVLMALFLQQHKYKAAHCKFVVFGKSNQQDLENKITAATGKTTWGQCVSTLHSFSFQIWRGTSKVSQYKIESDGKYEKLAQRLGAIAQKKQGEIVWGHLDKPNEHGSPQYCGADAFVELVDKLRVYCVGEITVEAIADIASKHNIDIVPRNGNQQESLEVVAGWASKVLEEGATAAIEKKWIDYTDMMWVLWRFKETFQTEIDKWRDKLKFIGVDEAQDMSLLQVEVLKLLNNPANNFFCFVGDRWQAIYGFRGSFSSGMDLLTETFDAERFELPLNFRCGKGHLAFVNEVFPHISIEPRADAPLGDIRCIHEKNLPELLKSKDIPTFGIARRNTSLIKTAITLVLAGLPVKLKDESIVLRIESFVKQAVVASKRPYSPDTLADVLGEFAANKIKGLPENRRSIVASEMQDIRKCCLLLAKQYQISTLYDWNKVLTSLFSYKENANIELHTIHSGKGGEGQRVLFLSPGDTPLKHPEQTVEELQQEENAIYVALTRILAKTELPGSGMMWLVIDEVEDKNGEMRLNWPKWLPKSMRSLVRP